MKTARPTQSPEEERFIEYLHISGLSDRTIIEYQKYFRIFPHDKPLTEELIWNFLRLHSGSITRAFVKLYLKFKKVKDIDIPDMRGAKKSRLLTLLAEDEYIIMRKALYQRNIKWGLMFDISYWCGLRREEICMLQPAWLVLEEYSEGKPMRVKVIGKRNKERIVVVPASIASSLLKYMTARFEAMEIGNTDPIFKVGVHYWWEICKEMSMRHLGRRVKPHDLRHTRATNWLKDGVDLIKIKERLGHASIATTERYTHMTSEQTASDWEDDLNQTK